MEGLIEPRLTIKQKENYEKESMKEGGRHLIRKRMSMVTFKETVVAKKYTTSSRQFISFQCTFE